MSRVVIDYEQIPYGLFKDDNRGFRHSIDKLVVDYKLRPGLTFSGFLERFSYVSSFQFVSDRGEDGYNSYFDRPPSSYYSWFMSAFWFPHVNVKFGAYLINDWKDRLLECKHNNLLRIEFNPNKVFQDVTFCHLISVIKEFFFSGLVIEVDYAVDLPFPTSSIITQSRKTKIIYGDSRYYGKRHSHGRLKVYNKSKELADKYKISLSSLVSRCEITFRFSGDIDVSNVYLCSGELCENHLSKNLQTIASLIVLASSYGEDREELLTRFVPDKRNRDMLYPVLFGDMESVFDFVRFFDLLLCYSQLYNMCYFFGGPLGQSYGFNF